MRGELTPSQQLTLLSKIWGPVSGYVFLPHIAGSSRTPERRKATFREGRAFPWPSGKEEILDHLKLHGEDDLYFTPAVFEGKRRIEQNLSPERTLWADLDEADPREFDQHYRPTIAWESSPGRFQAIWILNTPKTGASWAGRENHRLTLYLGADKSGWDSTQLLRVPGRPNHKPQYGDAGVPGKLLWDNGPRYRWGQFDDLPEVGVVDQQVELVDEDLLQSIDRHKVWSRVKLKVSRKVREYMASRSTEGADRSEVLWQIERELADAGCSMVEIVALIRPSVWNKFAGRSDELKRLKVEAAKAVGERGDFLEPDLDKVSRPDNPSWGNTWFHTPTPRPRWMVRDIWAEGACGFIAGAPKSYKSWMALDLALSVATGLPFLKKWDVITSGPVLYLQEEDGVSLVKDRYRMILEGKDPRWHPGGSVSLPVVKSSTSTPCASPAPHSGPLGAIHHPPAGDVPVDMQVQSGFVASDPAWQDWLEDRISSHHFRLVVIDTLTTTAGDIDTDHSRELMNGLLKPLKVIAQKHNTAICVVHHNRKSDSNGRAGQEMLGSVALHAWVDCALYARSKEGSEVTVDRESKSSTDLRFVVKVPLMYEDPRGEEGARQLWEPVISERGDDVPQVTPHRPASTAGKRLSERLKAMGSRWLTSEEITDVMGRDMGGQINAALANGYLERDSEGRLRVTPS